MDGIEITTLPDIPRVITAVAEWMACVQVIMLVKPKRRGVPRPLVFAGFLVLQISCLILTENLSEQSNAAWILSMFAAVGLMFGQIIFCCEINLRDAGYYTVQAFVTAEFAASLEWQIDCYYLRTTGRTSMLWHILVFFFVYSAVYTILYLLYRRHMNQVMNIKKKELFSAIVIGIAIFAMSNIGFVSHNTLFSARYSTEIFIIRTIVDLGGVAILYAYHVTEHGLRVSHELEIMESVLHNQYVQYQQSQELMDSINYKYHDLKHHLIALRAEDSQEKREEYLNRMEEEIRGYGSHVKTGNAVLDTLMTTKGMVCTREEITMTSVINGCLLDFMDVIDICSIFGNALDNAIECELLIPEKEKRLIHVSTFSQKGFLIIRFENYYEGKLEFWEKLPVTTKKKKQFHGYGLKSIQHIVHKYYGEVDISTKENWFVLNILIPMKDIDNSYTI